MKTQEELNQEVDALKARAVTMSKTELANEADAIARRVLGLFESKKTDKPDVFNFTEDEREEVKHSEPKMAVLRDAIKKINQEGQARKTAEELSEQANAPKGRVPFPTGAQGDGSVAQPWQPRKSFGRMFVESDAFKKYDRQMHQGPEIEMKLDDFDMPGANFNLSGGAPAEYKTVVDEAGSYAPQAIRIPYISQFPTRKLVVMDIVPQGQTTQIAIVYMEETTYTNAAVEIAESASYPEGAVAFTQRTSTVRKIAVNIPITDEIMEDAPQAESYVNNRIGYMVRQRLDSQLIVGNGTPPNLAGILNVGSVQTQAVGADTPADACHKALVLVQSVGFADPDHFVLHPLNWQAIRLTKTSTGEYVYGAPWESGPGTLWGLPVVSTTAITANTGLVGAFSPFSQFFLKNDLAISVGLVNDQFIKGQLTIRAQLRGAFVVYRPTAFCKITSMPQ